MYKRRSFYAIYYIFIILKARDQLEKTDQPFLSDQIFLKTQEFFPQSDGAYKKSAINVLVS